VQERTVETVVGSLYEVGAGFFLDWEKHNAAARTAGLQTEIWIRHLRTRTKRSIDRAATICSWTGSRLIQRNILPSVIVYGAITVREH
jgi:hypothetical protein